MCKDSTEVWLRDSPAKDLLSETLERSFRKWLSEDVSELFLGVNSLDLNVLREVRPEPMDFDIIELRPGSGLTRIQVGKGFSAAVLSSQHVTLKVGKCSSGIPTALVTVMVRFR